MYDDALTWRIFNSVANVGRQKENVAGVGVDFSTHHVKTPLSRYSVGKRGIGALLYVVSTLFMRDFVNIQYLKA